MYHYVIYIYQIWKLLSFKKSFLFINFFRRKSESIIISKLSFSMNISEYRIILEIGVLFRYIFELFYEGSILAIKIYLTNFLHTN